jgi:hypothetical protein
MKFVLNYFEAFLDNMMLLDNIMDNMYCTVNEMSKK